MGRLIMSFYGTVFRALLFIVQFVIRRSYYHIHFKGH
jgi:hypothetical protein